MPTADDNRDEVDPIVTCDPSSGSQFSLGAHTVNCSATDAAGNIGTGSFTVTITEMVDGIAPVIDAHDTVTEEATGPDGAIVSYTLPTASDNVDSSVTVNCSPASGSQFALNGPSQPTLFTTVTCNADDAAGNHAEPTTFQVIVTDSTAPTIGDNDDMTVEATKPEGADVSFDLPTATDLVDQNVDVECLPASGSTFALGANTVTCTATDDFNNSTVSDFLVTVVDTTPPVIDAHDDVTGVEATSAAGAVVSYTIPTTSDLVDGPGTATCVPDSGSTFALGTTTVHCNASDAAGNDAAETTFSVEVVDTTPPVIAAHADILGVEATSAAGAVVTYINPATSDAVDGAGTAICALASGSTFALGNNTVLCNAVDAAGNDAVQTSFTVQVVDTTPPTIAAHADVNANATSAAGAVVSYTLPTASDIVDGSTLWSACRPPAAPLPWALRWSIARPPTSTAIPATAASTSTSLTSGAASCSRWTTIRSSTRSRPAVRSR